MGDLNIRKEGRAGRITFTRPQALNALTHDMAQAIHAALDDWRDDEQVALVLIDAEGERAFCAGGDIAALYRAAKDGDHDTGRRFFRDEYLMNAAIDEYIKPIAVFMQGFVMGGGVGVGGHASHRVVGDTSQVAMPETGIGMVPDVGGTWLLARAPGRVGEYLGLTGMRMGAGDAIFAGFADLYLPEAKWDAAKARLIETGDITTLKGQTPPPSALERRDLAAFGAPGVAAIIKAAEESGDMDAVTAMRRASPLSLAATLALVSAARGDRSIRESLAREFRFTWRATAASDFPEGVRAQLIDKDRDPQWSAAHDTAKVDEMLAPLGADELVWEDQA